MMTALGLVAPASRKWTQRWVTGGIPTLALTALLTLTLVGLPLADRDVADVPLVLFMVPVGLCAARFGTRGGLAAGTLGASIACLWYFTGRHFASGGIDLLTQIVVFELVGLMVGVVSDSRRDLQRAITNHQELSLDLICTASFEGFFTSVNPAGERLLGYQTEELLSRPFLDFVHPDDQEATMDEMKRQTEAGLSVLNFRNRYRCKDGSYLWLEWTSRPDPRGKNLVAVARDVTERVSAEAFISAHRDQLQQLVYERTSELEQRNRDLEAARLEMLRRLALAAEFRDDSTFEHIERVGQTALLIAQALGECEHDTRLIRLAAPLHDVGKLGVSDKILLKPGKLTAAEFEQVKEHTVYGASVLADSSDPVLQLAELIALSHHEWWSGNGYPQGLKGDQIPLAARIVALADVFDALTHTRPYKHAWPIDDAAAEIRRLRGIQFDPAVVDAFDKLDLCLLAGPDPERAHALNHGPNRAVTALSR
jgi:PAS domain S-box-containing protein